MERDAEAIKTARERLTALVDGSLGIVFLALAAWFLLGPKEADIPLAASAIVTRAQISPGAFRTTVGDPPGTRIGGFVHNCNNCHRLFESSPLVDRMPMQHRSVLLDHGMNDRCYNCHDVKNRERLVLIDGSTVSFSETPRLCAQCHGTVFRDWERGMHGKTLGSWLAEEGNQRRLGCAECHDPHAPAYEKISPLPGPNTLRMGAQGGAHGHPDRHEPLRRWSRPPTHAPGGDHGPAAPAGEDHP